jgi:hypothetical protein
MSAFTDHLPLPLTGASLPPALWWLLGPPPLLLNLVHGIYVCLNFRSSMPRSTFWLTSLVLSLGACFVSSTLRFVLLGLRPEWLTSDWAIPTYILAWWLVHHAPLIKDALSLFPAEVVVTALEMVHKGRTITGAIDITIRTIGRPVWVGPLLLGTMSTCVGGFYKAAVENVMTGRQTVTELCKPTTVIKLGFYCSIFYLLTTDLHHHLAYFDTPLLTKELAALLMTYYLVVVGIAPLFMGPFSPFPISLAVPSLGSDVWAAASRTADGRDEADLPKSKRV